MKVPLPVIVPVKVPVPIMPVITAVKLPASVPPAPKIVEPVLPVLTIMPKIIEEIKVEDTTEQDKKVELPIENPSLDKEKSLEYSSRKISARKPILNDNSEADIPPSKRLRKSKMLG